MAGDQSPSSPGSNPGGGNDPIGDPIGRDEIESLLKQSAAAGEPSASPGSDEAALAPGEIETLVGTSGVGPAAAGGAARSAAATAGGARAAAASEPTLGQGDIEFLLSQAEAALASITDPNDEMPPGVLPFQFKDLAGSPASTESATIELVRDVQLDLQIELGRTHMYLEDVLKLRKGAVVPLDKLAGDPVDIYVNGRMIARGEILVLNDNFCVRVAELIAGEAAA